MTDWLILAAVFVAHALFVLFVEWCDGVLKERPGRSGEPQGATPCTTDADTAGSGIVTVSPGRLTR